MVRSGKAAGVVEASRPYAVGGVIGGVSAFELGGVVGTFFELFFGGHVWECEQFDVLVKDSRLVSIANR